MTRPPSMVTFGKILSLALLCGVLVPAVASAQIAEPPPPPPPPPRLDGVRFRGGVSVGAGAEFASGFSVGMGAFDGRAGVQVNNWLAFYAQGGGSLGVGNVPSRPGMVFTGSGDLTANVDLTIVDRFFIAAGGGGGVLENSIGPEAHFRLGGYPLMELGRNGYIRKGLMVSADARIFFLPGTPGFFNVVQVVLSIGYEVY